MSSDETPEGIESIVVRIHAMGDRPRDQYDEFSSYSRLHQSSIYARLDGNDRGRLWTEHVDRYRREHPNLSSEQQKVLTLAREILGNSATSIGEVTTQTHQRLERLKAQAIEAFGYEEAYGLLAKLGA